MSLAMNQEATHERALRFAVVLSELQTICRMMIWKCDLVELTWKDFLPNERMLMVRQSAMSSKDSSIKCKRQVAIAIMFASGSLFSTPAVIAKQPEADGGTLQY